MVGLGASARKKWRDRAEALNRIYKRSGVSPEQAKAWYRAHLEWSPLLQALIKIIRAERNLTCGQEDVDPVRMAEVRYCRAVRAANNRRRQAVGQLYNRYLKASKLIDALATMREAQLSKQ